jgi:hypothetical protein
MHKNSGLRVADIYSIYKGQLVLSLIVNAKKNVVDPNADK